ncbi:hypothetical protein [Muriicola sp. Z0-33]|uniref:hypothetical protein n=1 Tax=Muriicola sp. Z0-33 TaxID=2816957 RepID=UPI0022383914|nr:hypothetical protein [Muriicola sp. Z0-33]MCW5516156.1 hypothetical protein [Muriicola sp. Z0-33]
MITAYYRLVLLSDEVKAKNNIKVGAKVPRYDCVEYSGQYDGINPFINPKGMFKLSLMDTKEFVIADKRRMAEFALVGGKNLNFSSLYFEDANSNIGYGNPNGKPYLKDGRNNPVFSFRQDLYIFLIDDAFTQLEILVLRNQKGFAGELLQSILGGDFDAEIENHRNRAKTFYSYG